MIANTFVVKRATTVCGNWSCTDLQDELVGEPDPDERVAVLPPLALLLALAHGLRAQHRHPLNVVRPAIRSQMTLGDTEKKRRK